MAKKFVIQTPRGSIYTVNGKGGNVTARIEWNKNFSNQKGILYLDSGEYFKVYE